MAVLTLVLGAAAAVGLAVLLFRAIVSYLDFRRCELSMPGLPTLPVLGNALDMVTTTEANVWEVAMKVWGGRTELTRIAILNRLLVFVTDPDDLAALYRRKDFADKSRFFYEFLEHLGPKGLVVLNGTEWKHHRVATQPAFHLEILDSYDEVFSEEAENFVKRIVPNEEQDLHHNLYQALSRNFVRTAMTSEVTPESESVLVEMVDFVQVFLRSLNERSIKPWLWSNYIFDLTPTSKKLKKGVHNLHEFIRGIMKKRRDKLVAEGIPEDFVKRRKTLLDVLIDAQRENKFELTDEAILDEIIIFIGASVETSSSTISSTLKLLSINEDIQEKLHDEVMSVLGDSKRNVTLADLTKMEYLDKVIKETLRVLPGIPFVARQVKEKTEFAGKKLPAGTTLIINMYGVHRDARYWDEPHRYNPDRFSGENGGVRHPYAYIPFSSGARNCIGYRYAQQFIKYVVATTIRDYRIDRANDGITDFNQLHLTFDLSLREYGGTKVKFTRRT